MELTTVRTVSGKEVTLSLTTRLGFSDYQRAHQLAAGTGRSIGQWAREIILAALADQANEVKNERKSA